MNALGCEQWLPIPRYEHRYMVSSWGNVVSNASGEWTALRKGKCLDGYYKVSLCDKRQHIKPKVCKIAALVAEAFIGSRPTGHQVNHKDSNRQNDRVTNLEYVTPRENIHHCIRTGNHRMGMRAIVGYHRTTGEGRYFISSSEAARHGFTKPNVTKCLAGKRAVCKEYVWEYA